MIKTHVSYNSLNEIYFHHSTNTDASLLPFTRASEVHLQCEMLWLISGIVQYKIDGETYTVNPGDIILVNKGELHSMFVDLKEPFERMVFQFSPKFIPTLVDYDPSDPFINAKTFQHVIPRQFVDKTKIKNLFQSIKRVCAKPDRFTDLKLISLLFSLLKEINEATDKMKKAPKRPTETTLSVDKFSKRCTKYINQNITRRLTAKDIAQHMYVCESHLHHLFKKEMGISVCAYILNQKMQMAALMLKEGKSPQKVAEALGYDYYSTFFKNFQAYFGHTPKEHERYLHTIVTGKIPKHKLLVSERIKKSLKIPTTDE